MFDLINVWFSHQPKQDCSDNKFAQLASYSTNQAEGAETHHRGPCQACGMAIVRQLRSGLQVRSGALANGDPGWLLNPWSMCWIGQSEGSAIEHNVFHIIETSCWGISTRHFWDLCIVSMVS